jgi:putative hydrolase of the HAD superfamily
VTSDGGRDERRSEYVVFDVFGTLIRPEPAVASVYAAIGQAHGSAFDERTVAQRLSAARRKHFPCARFTGDRPVEQMFPTSEYTQRRRWRAVVAEVFDDLDDTESVFAELWQWFSRSDNWRVHEDVVPCWRQLRSRGLGIGLASNFDERLMALAGELEPLDTADHVLCSARIGFDKPDQAFFRGIAKVIGRAAGSLLIIGDDPYLDGVAGQWSGSRSIVIARSPPRAELADAAGQQLTVIEHLGLLDALV